MSGRIRVAFVLAAAAAVAILGLVAEWAAYGPDGYAVPRSDATYPPFLDLATGYAVLASGLVGALRRPASLVGPLFILTAAAWFAGTLLEPSRYVGTAMTPSLVFLYRGFLAHAVPDVPYRTPRRSRGVGRRPRGLRDVRLRPALVRCAVRHGAGRTPRRDGVARSPARARLVQASTT